MENLYVLGIIFIGKKIYFFTIYPEKLHLILTKKKKNKGEFRLVFHPLTIKAIDQPTIPYGNQNESHTQTHIHTMIIINRKSYNIVKSIISILILFNNNNINRIKTKQ